jgi:hypothetical protein
LVMHSRSGKPPSIIVLINGVFGHFPVGCPYSADGR